MSRRDLAMVSLEEEEEIREDLPLWQKTSWVQLKAEESF